MQDYGRSPRMLSDQALGMFSTPESMAEAGLRQAMRTEALALQPDEQMIGYDEGGAYGKDYIPPPRPRVGQMRPPEPRDRFKYLRPGANWGTDPGVNPFGQTAVNRNDMLDYMSHQNWGNGIVFDENGLVDQAGNIAPEGAVPGAVASGSALASGFGDVDTSWLKSVPLTQLPALAPFVPPEMQGIDPVDLEQAGADYAAKRKPAQDAALKPMQDQVDLLGADAKEIERNSKWDALINLGLTMVQGGAPSFDPKSGNFMGILGNGMADYIKTVRSDKDRVREIKREAAQLSAQLGAQRFGMEEQAIATGQQLGGLKFNQGATITQNANQNAMGIAGLNMQYLGMQNQRDMTQAGLNNAANIANVTNQNNAMTDLMQSQLAANAKLQAAGQIGIGEEGLRRAEQTALEYVKQQFGGEAALQSAPKAQVDEAYKFAITRAVYTRLVDMGVQPAQAMQKAEWYGGVSGQVSEDIDPTGNSTSTAFNRILQNPAGPANEVTQPRWK